MQKAGEVLELLRSQSQGFVSGEDLSARLNVTRSSVWKYIRHLESAGYQIEAVPHLGYKLVSVPDRLLPDEIAASLQTEIFGKKIFCYQETTSTNDRALELAGAHMPEGTLVAAEHQTQGRGRRERNWNSKAQANLLFSLIFRPPWTAEQAPLVTLLMAVAAAKSIRAVTGLPAEIKWPNDIYLQGAKAGGILTEMQAQADQVAFIVCGVGINVNSAPHQGMRTPAISLAKALGQPVLRIPLLQRMLRETEQLYRKILKSGADDILYEWKRLSCLDGRQVLVEQPRGATLTGLAMGSDETGALLLRQDTGVIERITCGEVSMVKPCC